LSGIQSSWSGWCQSISQKKLWYSVGRYYLNVWWVRRYHQIIGNINQLYSYLLVRRRLLWNFFWKLVHKGTFLNTQLNYVNKNYEHWKKKMGSLWPRGHGIRPGIRASEDWTPVPPSDLWSRVTSTTIPSLSVPLMKKICKAYTLYILKELLT